MDRKQQPAGAGTGGGQQPVGPQDQQDLSQSDFSRSDQGTGTSESQTGHSWDPAAGGAAGSDHPQTVQAEPTGSGREEPGPSEAEGSAAARNDSETGGR